MDPSVFSSMPPSVHRTNLPLTAIPGYREFYAYLTNPHATAEDLAKAVEDMKTSTRQYAKRQVQWIRNQLRPVVEGSDQSEHQARLYLLDATGEWKRGVGRVVANGFCCRFGQVGRGGAK